MEHFEFLTSVCSLKDKDVADIGAGDGTHSGHLREQGARVSAIEIDAAKVAVAKEKLGPKTVVLEGRAEDLPLGSQSQDLLCLFFSFHHVPMNMQEMALNEFQRVLRPAGRLHIVEPLPFGTMFDVVKLAEDETIVRTHSHKLLRMLNNLNVFEMIAKMDYALVREFPDFDAFLDRTVRPYQERMARLPKIECDLQKAFQKAVGGNYGGSLTQPCVAYHFTMKDVSGNH